MSRRPSRRKQVPIRSRASAASAVASAVASDEPLANLKGVELKRATDGQTVDAASIVPSSGRVMVPFLTQFADFDSWELAQKLVDDIPELDANGVTLVAVGIGSVEAAKEFSGAPTSRSTASMRTRPPPRTKPSTSPRASVARAASSVGSGRSSPS